MPEIAYIFDTETTGKVDSQPIEAAWLRLVAGAEDKPAHYDERVMPVKLYGVTNDYIERFKPTKPIEFGALATHHILESDLVDCCPYTELKLPEDAQYLIGHNIDFDWEVIGKPDIKRIDTLALARAYWRDDLGHSQSACAYRLNLDYAHRATQNAHNALADVNICLQILDHICDQWNIRSFEELHQLSQKALIPTVMTFGKHKGLPMAEVPADYKQWYRRQADTDPYMIKAMNGEEGLTDDVITKLVLRGRQHEQATVASQAGETVPAQLPTNLGLEF